MHLKDTYNRHKLCESVTSLTGVKLEGVTDIHLLQTYILFAFMKECAGSEYFEKYQNIPHTLYDTLELSPNFFVHLQALPSYKVQLIANDFQKDNLDRFLVHMAPTLVKNIPSALLPMRRDRSFSIYRLAMELFSIARSVEEYQQALLLHKKDPEGAPLTKSLFDYYLSRMGHYDDHLTESAVNSVADHMTSYVLPVRQLSARGTRGLNPSFHAGKKIFDLLNGHRITNSTQLMLLDEFIQTGTIDLDNLKHNHGIYTIDSIVLKKLIGLYKGIITDNKPIEPQFIHYITYCHFEANANNSPIEMGLVFPQMRKLLASKYNIAVLLVDPPPQLVDEWCRRQWCNYVDATIVLTRSTEQIYCVHLYRHFASVIRDNSHKAIHFCTPDELTALSKEYTSVFYFSNDDSPALPSPCLPCFKEVKRPVGVYALCAPAHLVTLKDLTEQIGTTQIAAIDLLPRDIPNAIGNPLKIFIHYKLYNSDPVQELHLSNYILTNDSNDGYMLSQSQNGNVTIPHPIPLDVIPRTLFHESAYKQARKTDETRTNPICYPFTKELSIWYAKHKDATVSSGYRYSATFRLPLEKQQRIRNANATGEKIKCVTGTNSKCTDDTVCQWLEHTYPFKVRAKVIEAVGTRCLHEEISLKLFCYLNPDLDDRLDGFQLEVLWQLLRTDIGSLPLNSTADQFNEAIATSFAELTDVALSYYWDILSTVVELGVDKNLLAENLLTETVVEYQKRRRDLIAEVRGAVVRRAFSTQEIKDMLCEIAYRVKDGHFTYNAVLIRIATGLQPAIISALQWNDLAWSEGSYSISISHNLLQRAAIHTPSIMKKRVRFIPCTPFLIQGLSSAYEKLTAHPLSGAIRGAAKGRPVVFHVEEDDTYTPILPNQINRLCKEMILAAHVDPEILLLEEDGETTEIDINALHGDIFHSNLGHYSRETSMDMDDVAYSLGNTPVSTFGRSYYGPHEECSLYNLYKHLLKWDQLMAQAMPKAPQRIHQQAVKQFEHQVGKSALITLTVSRRDSETMVELLSQHGINATIQTLNT